MARDGLPVVGEGVVPREHAASVPPASLPRRTLAPLPLLALLPARPALAQEAPAELQVAGRRLVLNGTGVRRFLLIEVFRGWLYLERRSTDAAAIIASNGTKLLRLRYAVPVPKDRLVGGWEEGFRDGCNCEMPPAFRARLRDLPVGQVEDWLFLPDRTEIAYAGEAPATVTAQNGAMMLASFIGPNAESAGLRRGLLGGA